LHFDVAINGGTVVRPLFFEFVNDTQARNIDHQFLWGASMMIIPVTNQSTEIVFAYIPHGLWYSIRYSDYGDVYENGNAAFKAPITDLIPVLLRGKPILTVSLFWYQNLFEVI
uniref:Sucrase-isomaltase, intestinal n=1 Tax=Gongylonema pulchrum TaxID=637853 RepID=A0A183DM95_9BILA